jgi:hypothetical protein
MPLANGAEAAAAVVIGARLVTATAVRHAARWVNLMMTAPRFDSRKDNRYLFR